METVTRVHSHQQETFVNTALKDALAEFIESWLQMKELWTVPGTRVWTDPTEWNNQVPGVCSTYATWDALTVMFVSPVMYEPVSLQLRLHFQNTRFESFKTGKSELPGLGNGIGYVRIVQGI